LHPDELSASYPTWSTLPAVQAGQLSPWNAETVLSPQGFAVAVAELTDHVDAARTDVV
jgi:hypothetical protein